MSLSLGSLFDGIGGFPLAAQRHGITPVWASEIEGAPVSITKKHFPDMLHLGNITEIKGAEIAPVDIITFGSPCQDLSVAGKREGLDGERSGLFMEAVRIIREMRGATNGAKPRWCVWENVPGSFSSNGGADFLTVIREIAETADKNIHVPRPPTADGVIVWEPAGAIVGDGGSLAWRVLDAQYWGVPQRRRRIFLVADFGGERAGEVLFKPESLRGDHAESGAAGEGTAADAAGGFEETDATVIPINTQVATRHNKLGERTGLGIGKEGDPRFTLQENHSHAVAVWPEVAGSLLARADGSPYVDRGQPFVCAGFSGGQGAKANGIGYGEELAPTLKGVASGTNQVPCIVLDARGNGCGEVAPTMTGDHNGHVSDYTALAIGYTPSSFAQYMEGVGTIKANGGDLGGGSETLVTAFAMQGFGDYKESESASALKSRDFKDATDLVGYGYAVRRLTPTECERLQGFPDGWTAYGHDGKPISDTQRYKALGNSVAIPCVDFIMGNIAKIMEAR